MWRYRKGTDRVWYQYWNLILKPCCWKTLWLIKIVVFGGPHPGMPSWSLNSTDLYFWYLLVFLRVPLNLTSMIIMIKNMMIKFYWTPWWSLCSRWWLLSWSSWWWSTPGSPCQCQRSGQDSDADEALSQSSHHGKLLQTLVAHKRRYFSVKLNMSLIWLNISFIKWSFLWRNADDAVSQSILNGRHKEPIYLTYRLIVRGELFCGPPITPNMTMYEKITNSWP